ncbi:MAG: amidohydrolase family protein, partial [Pseudomonadota bacterium]
LDALGITASTPVPVGGELRLADDGTPSGILLNRALELLDSGIPTPSPETLAGYLRAALARMAADGYVAVHEAGVSAAGMAVLQQLEDSGELPIRVYAMLSLRDEPLIEQWISRGPDVDTDSMLVTRSVKAYYDGALGSRGARLLEDYADLPGHRGISGDSYGFNQALNTRVMKAGFQVAIHAIGDAGNREALDIIENVYRSEPATANNRHRIEHAQVLHPDDMPRLARLGVIASMEPPHAMEDKTWAEDRLGPNRIRGAYAWRSLREAGARLTFNADNPGSDHSIFYGLHSAIARKDKQGQPPGGWYPEEAMTPEEAIRGYTTWSAYASFSETDTGVIATGKRTDLTVMDIDPFVLGETDPAALLDGSILMTLVDGKIIYERVE